MRYNEAVIVENKITIYEYDTEDKTYQKILDVQYVDKISIQIGKDFE
jgi:hypothetical protein